MLEPILIAGYSCCVIPTDTSVKGFDMSARKTPDAGKLDRIVAEANHPIRPTPAVPGYQWISSGHGDFEIGPTLIDVT